MPEIPWNEKRRTERIKINQPIPVHYELRPHGKYGDTVIQDISEGGIKIILDEFVPRLCRMAIQLNLFPERTTSAFCKISWLQNIPKSYRYQAGLEFIDISLEGRSEIAEYVKLHK